MSLIDKNFDDWFKQNVETQFLAEFRPVLEFVKLNYELNVKLTSDFVVDLSVDGNCLNKSVINHFIDLIRNHGTFHPKFFGHARVYSVAANHHEDDLQIINADGYPICTFFRASEKVLYVYAPVQNLKHSQKQIIGQLCGKIKIKELHVYGEEQSGTFALAYAISLAIDKENFKKIELPVSNSGDMTRYIRYHLDQISKNQQLTVF